MEKVLELYKYIDGVNDAPFPNDKEQVVISSFRYDAKRMGGAPTISCSFMHHLCLDKMWDYNVYAIFNGEKYFVKQIPTSSYDNTDSRYKHELELASERVILDNVYVYDVVDSDSSSDKPISNSSNFAFFGDIHEFASRLNQSLKYSKVGYSVVVDEGITSEPKMVSFQDQFFSNAIQESYNTFNIPYYFVGKVIHFGYTNNAITNTFKYGQDESLLSIQKQNANYKIVNRVTGVGSADNIPYYYPNDYESKEEVEANGGTWINPQTNLMPSIYRESLGDERFYNALNNTYRIPNSDKYYEFANPYVEGKPKEHIVNFEDIKPTIKGITNTEGLRIDMFSEFAFDENDNDEFDEEGNYLHPYFFAKLRKFDGEHGFNLFDHSIDEQEMTISMTSGSCGACEFVIGVDESTQKNIVQVDDSGNLVRDDNGNIKFGDAQDRQNDTSNYEVWIALRKDVDTFGVIMPNATNNYKPSVNDTFVILHIDLPKAYILAAEENLKAQLIEYMSLNNSEKFNFSISFSRIFFAENPDILSQLNENARIQIEYDNTLYELYISSYSYSMSNDKPLPEIRVELTDTLTISQNALQTAISDIKSEIISTAVGSVSVDILKQGLRYFLRKDKDDRSKGTIASDKGFEAGKFNVGVTGAACYQDKDGNWHIETDHLKVRKKASFTEVEIETTYHVGGQQMSTGASMVVDYVLEMDSCYRCYFLKKDNNGRVTTNKWKPKDQAYCNTFNLVKQEDGILGNHYLWRLVNSTSNETADDAGTRTFGDVTINTDDYHFTDLSKTVFAEGSDIPKALDEIVLLGHQGDDESRQGCIIVAGAGEGSPYIYEFTGINSFTLPEPETRIKPGDNFFTGMMRIQGGSTGAANLEDFPEEVFKSVHIGAVNLLRNSGFTGDYKSEELNSAYSLQNGSELFSRGLKHWTGSAAVSDDANAVSGKCAVVGSLSQTVELIKGESYVVSFSGKGASVKVMLGGASEESVLSASYEKYSFKFVSDGVCTFSISGDATICDLQLERGTIATDWKPSPYDNDKTLAEFQALKYLQDAIVEGDTTILGGLILSSIIKLGNFKDGKMQKVNAGVSGIYNDDDDVAFWGGGTFEQAIKTVMKFKENPLYRPTDLEWQSLANFVVTHGGDLFLRGYIHAKGGVIEHGIFKDVKSQNGSFEIDDEGNVKIIGTFETSVAGKRIIIDADSQSIVLYDELGRETAKMNFYGDVGESWTYGSVQLRRYQQDSSNLAMESFISASQVDVIDYITEYKSHYRAGFMQAMSIDGKNASMTISLQKQYESPQPSSEYSWLSIIQSDCWPTSSEDVGVGGIYSDNGTLKVKR